MTSQRERQWLRIALGERRRRLMALALGFVVLVPALVGSAAAAPASDLPVTRSAAAADKAAAPAAKAGAPVDKAAAERDPGTVVLRFHREVAAAAKGKLIADRGLRLERAVEGTEHVVVSTQGRPPEEVARQLASDRRVASVELNPTVKAAVEPNDLDSLQAPYLRNLGMPSAWDRTTGSNLTIAVVDSGVATSHPDLVGHFAEVAGYDYVNRDAFPEDDNGHGTMVAGIAAANTNNSRGVAGVGWNSRILPVKVLNSGGSGNHSDVASGITFAANQNAKVINLSFGGPVDSSVLRDAVNYALGRGAVVVAAAGNESSAGPFYPAAYPGVVSVTATDHQGDFAWFSNYGPNTSLAAPGMSIRSTEWGGSYAVGSGTSFSAPIVSGVASLVRSVYPQLSQAQVVERLRATARDAGPRGFDNYHGHGWVDPSAAVGGPQQADLPPPPVDVLEPNGQPGEAGALPEGTAASATISPQGDQDWFFTDVAARRSLNLSVQPPAFSLGRAANMDPVIEFFGPDLQLLGRANSTGGGQSEQLTVPAAQPGRYYTRVRNQLGSRSSGAYSVSMSSSNLPEENYNGDGASDVGLFYDYGNGSSALFTFNGPALNVAARPWLGCPGCVAPAASKPFDGDFNGDGRTDVGALFDYGNGTSGIFVWHANSSGFDAPTRPWLSCGGCLPWERSKPFAADFNGDGKDDVGILYNYGGGTSALFTFNGPNLNAPTRPWISCGGCLPWESSKPFAADFNGDGKDDVGVLYNYGGGTSALFTFNGPNLNAPTRPWLSCGGCLTWESSQPL
ncbi:MAG: S8 family serine peptidase [Actinomycetota bacterium]|nr:S8 family serine peptidase [Actinomycetota bacterium]